MGLKVTALRGGEEGVEALPSRSPQAKGKTFRFSFFPFFLTKIIRIILAHTTLVQCPDGQEHTVYLALLILFM